MRISLGHNNIRQGMQPSSGAEKEGHFHESGHPFENLKFNLIGILPWRTAQLLCENAINDHIIATLLHL